MYTHILIVAIEDIIKEYNREWEFIDEKLNVKELPIKDWVTSEKYCEIYKELRMIVDDMMRIEYELLQKALAKDNKKKYKPPKKGRGKKGKGKKGKKKGKKVKDITGHRMMESLYYEMEDHGLIRNYSKRTFDEWIGEYNYCAYDLRNYMMRDSIAAKGEVRDLLREYMIGMGPLDITKPKSIILGGPQYSGKRLLLDIMATEIDAVVINLSPEVTYQYADNLKYLIHLVTKMARILQPTIIEVQQCHRVFWKKVPKDLEYMRPTLLQGNLFKAIVKPLKITDKIFVVGTTDFPWMAKGKMKKAFEKVVLLPKTDYGTSYLTWRQTSLGYNGVNRDFEFSPVALVTREYETGDMVRNVKDVLNIRRRMKLSRYPLDPREFLNRFMDDEKFPLNEADTKKFMKWYLRSSKLAKQRVKFMKLMDLLRAAAEKKKQDQKAKAKKK